MEAVDGPDAPRLALRALGLGPDHRLGVGLVDEVAAGRDLDPVAAGLERVEEEAGRDRVARRRGLDVDVVVEEDVGRPQALLAGVDPEREVVQAAAGAARVLDVDQLVGGDREAQPGAGLLAVVEPDALVVPVAENVGRERPAGGDVVGEQVDVVEALDRRAARRVALRLVAQRGLEVVGRDVALALPVQLAQLRCRTRPSPGRRRP